MRLSLAARVLNYLLPAKYFTVISPMSLVKETWNPAIVYTLCLWYPDPQEGESDRHLILRVLANYPAGHKVNINLRH